MCRDEGTKIAIAALQQAQARGPQWRQQEQPEPNGAIKVGTIVYNRVTGEERFEREGTPEATWIAGRAHGAGAAAMRQYDGESLVWSFWAGVWVVMALVLWAEVGLGFAAPAFIAAVISFGMAWLKPYEKSGPGQ